VVTEEPEEATDNSLSPQLIHALSTSDHQPYQPFIRSVMLGAPGHSGHIHQAHWDTGASVSLLPEKVLATLPGATIYKSDDLNLHGVGGPLSSLGLVNLTVYLTPYSKITCDFRVLRDDQLRTVLIGGDILQVFNALFHTGNRTVRLMAPNHQLETVYFETEAQWPDPGDSPPYLVFEALVDGAQTPGEARIPRPPASTAILLPDPAGTDNRPIPAAYGPDFSALDSDRTILEVRQQLLTEQQDVTQQTEARLAALRARFADIFVTAKEQVKASPPCPTERPWDFKVELMTDPPSQAYSRPPTQDPIQNQFFSHWLQRMQSSGARPGARWNNAITRATGELHYVAPARAITKQDGDYTGPVDTWDLRVIVDYRQVNSNTALKGRYACPNIQDLLNSVATKRYKSKMDLRHGFFNVGIADEFTRRCFAFSTPHGIFLPNVMPMGAKGSPDALMNMMTTIFEALIAKNVMFVYLDDLLIATDYIETHFETLEEVFTLAARFDLSFKLAKCEFFKLEIQFLGYTISPNALQPGRRLSEAIQSMRAPTSKAEVKSFVQLCNFFRPFVPDFARIAAPLTDMQRGETPYRWDEPQLRAFIGLKRLFSTFPILRPFGFGKPTATVHDASTEGGGAVLLQQDDTPEGPWHAVDFWSCRWSADVSKHSITELETRALVQPIDTVWRKYLVFQPFTAYTDHMACTYLMHKADHKLTKHDERSKVKLSGYALERIEHVPGKHNEVADALSRLTSRYTYTLLVVDAYAGCGTFLRALDQSLPLHVRFAYAAIEYDPTARTVIDNIVRRINQARPGRVIPIHGYDSQLFPFQFGNDMTTLDLKAIASTVSQHSSSVCSGGPPCQPFSPANPTARRWDDPREGFHAMGALIACGFTFWYVENVPLTDDDATRVRTLFGPDCVLPYIMEAADLGPAQRRRMIWSNYTIRPPTMLDRQLYGFTWDDVLADDYVAPRQKAPTQVASFVSYADRRKDTLVTNIHDGTRRRMTPAEKEASLGLSPGDITTVVHDYKTVHRLVGNAFPVPCQRHLLKEASLQFSMAGTSHTQTDAYAFSVTTTVAGENTFPTESLQALAGRDLTYVERLATLPTDNSRFPHQKDGLIYTAPNRVEVPNSTQLRKDIVTHFHSTLGHVGPHKVTPILKETFYWSGMDRDIVDHIKTCPSCQLSKRGSQIAQALKTFTVDTGPWQTVHIDITMLYNGLPADAISSAVILVDRFSRYSIIIPCKHALSAPEMFALLDANFFCHYGIPHKIISDNGPPFSSHYWEDVLSLLGPRRGYSTAYRPETNGLVERMNRTVKGLLRSMLVDLQISGPEEMRKLIPWVMWTINRTYNSTISMTPHEALTMVKPRIPQHFVTPSIDAAPSVQRATQVYQHVTQHLHKWNQKIEEQHGYSDMWKPQVGDPVLVHRRRKGSALNLDEAEYAGPYPVLASIGNQLLLGNVPTSEGTAEVHVSRTKPARIRAEDKSPTQDAWNYNSVLFRDYSTIQTSYHPSLQVRWSNGDITSELEQGDTGRTFREHAAGHPMFLQKGITRDNVSDVYTFQTTVLHHVYPILVNTAPRAARSLTQAGARKKSLTPHAALMRWVLAEDNDLGLVDDYDQDDDPDRQWRVHWQSGQCTWHSGTFLLEHLYGQPGDDYAKALPPRLTRKLYEHLTKDHGLPLETFLKHNPSTAIASRRQIPNPRRRKR